MNNPPITLDSLITELIEARELLPGSTTVCVWNTTPDAAPPKRYGIGHVNNGYDQGRDQICVVLNLVDMESPVNESGVVA